MASWEAIVAQKQTERQSRIPKTWILSSVPEPLPADVREIPRSCGLLSPQELQITENYDATALTALIQKSEFTSEAVTTAFCKRAAIAHQLTNCLTEIFFDEGIERARWLDQELARTGKPVGPLHGLPISLKDTFKVKGFDTNAGVVCLVNNPAKENSTLVDILLEAGAVLYCKTNTSQFLQSLDGHNNVFGRTLNPRNRQISVGGSTSGEGALIAMRGSVLGVGTDIGGSIRIPAMCNGLYSFKPSTGRIPFAGQENAAIEGGYKIGLAASAGPIASTLRDCELLMKSVAAAKPWEFDPDVHYGYWEEQGKVEGTPLIGVVRTDGSSTPLPPINKFLEETVNRLKAAGCEVVEIDTTLFKKCQEVGNKLFTLDGGNYIFDLLEKSGEPFTPWLKPRLRRKKAIGLEGLVSIHAQRIELETAMLGVWKDSKSGRRIDALICPVAPHPAPPIDRYNTVNYTSSFVVLDYPAGTLPVRDLRGDDLIGELEGPVLGSWDKVNRELWPKSADDRKVYLNTTLSIQVVAPKLQERRLYQAMQYIDQVLHGHEPSSRARL